MLTAGLVVVGVKDTEGGEEEEEMRGRQVVWWGRRGSGGVRPQIESSPNQLIT